MRLLLVEDDARIARFVAKGLREQAYAVDVSGTGDDALYQAAINTYDLVILDVMIPGRNGFEVCRELRKSGQRMPILMLTARDAIEDRITGLDHGADDYLIKPFEFRELLARLRALLRRSGELHPAKIIVADLVLDTPRKLPRAPAAAWRLPPRNMRCSNFSRATPAASSAARRLRNTFGTRLSIPSQISSRFMSIACAERLTPIPSSLCCIPAVVRVIFSVLQTIQRAAARQTKMLRFALARKQVLPSGRAMFDSVRMRLTLWYTAVLTFVLVALSLITYFIFWRSTVQRTDTNLSELSEAFLTTLNAEVKDQSGPDTLKLAAQVAITEHRFRDHVFGVFDAAGKMVISSQDVPPMTSAVDSAPSGLLLSHSFQRFLEASSHSDRLFGEVKEHKYGYRGFARHFSSEGKTYNLVILQSLHPQEEMLEGVTSTFAWVIPIAILLASVGGYFLARKGLGPRS